MSYVCWIHIIGTCDPAGDPPIANPRMPHILYGPSRPQVYYTPEILESAGMESDNQKLGGQVLVGVVKVGPTGLVLPHHR